jgi:hypothetical protein
MHDPSLLLWRWSCLGPWGGLGFSLSLGLRRKPDLAGIVQRRVAHYDRFRLSTLRILLMPKVCTNLLNSLSQVLDTSKLP